MAEWNNKNLNVNLQQATMLKNGKIDLNVI
jgi:hypothetical protein